MTKLPKILVSPRSILLFYLSAKDLAPNKPNIRKVTKNNLLTFF